MLCSVCKERPKRTHSSYWCQECSNEYERKRWATIPKWKKTEKWLKTKYKISFKEFIDLFDNQKGLCKICNIEIFWEGATNHHQTACVDHNHVTGDVRGILCNHCNRAIGLMKEDKIAISNMLEYLNG